MNFPVATDKSAFISGLILPLPIMAFDLISSRNLLSPMLTNNFLWPLVIVSVLGFLAVFVAGIPRYKTSNGEIKYRFFLIPFSKQANQEMISTWRRMSICFLGTLLVISIFVVAMSLLSN